jgi:CheY-like chemotaxis protein
MHRLLHNILVVAPRADVREAISSMLGEAGFNVATTGTSREAESTLERSVPDLILLDAELPRADGRDVCKIIAPNGMIDPVPAIFMASSSTPGRREQGERAGAFLMTAIQKELLLAQVSAIEKVKRLLDQGDRALMRQGERIDCLTRENLQLQNMLVRLGNTETAHDNPGAPACDEFGRTT